MSTIVWFRGGDLRVADHAALTKAALSDGVIPLFVIEEDMFEDHSPNQTQFILDSLHSLAASLRALGSELVVAAGVPEIEIPRLVSRWGVRRVLTLRRADPRSRAQDKELAASLGARYELMEGETIIAPGTIRSGAGTPYAVFTPFSNKFRTLVGSIRPTMAPLHLPAVPPEIIYKSHDLPNLKTLNIIRNPRVPTGGEEAARKRLTEFIEGALQTYPELRDRMDLSGSSKLSSDLNHGALSPRTVWAEVKEHAGHTDAGQAFLRQLIWRDFTHTTLWDHPHVLETPFRQDWEGFPWSVDENFLDAWMSGQTGFPVVDASARQLLAEGLVHNRARMISASFLTKHLLIDYRIGEAHYMENLTDGNVAQNNFGWQWAAGCGCDGAPYFRVFNPMTQGEKFDPKGDYVRRWVPELTNLPARHIHRPWEAPASVLKGAGVQLGQHYPLPIVDHASARLRYLEIAKSHLASARLNRGKAA